MPYYYTNMKRLKNLHLNYVGLIVAVLFYGLALTPSLLPRPPLYIGLIAGISAAIGYGFGVLASVTYRYLEIKEWTKKSKKLAWKILPFILGFVVLGMTVQAARWQNQVRALVGESDVQNVHLLTVTFTALCTFVLLLTLSRLTRRGKQWLTKKVGMFLPQKLSNVLSLLVVTVFLVLLLNNGLYNGFLSVANSIYSGSNAQIDPNLKQPESLLRSGSSGSLATWDSLGSQGRNFVARGPSASTISKVTNEQAIEPIRIYVGLQTEPTAQERANTALQELIRTDAFSRKALVVVTPTGTGWIEPQAADSLEYITNGNSAMVAIQYSYLPSWISFISDTATAQEAGRTLLNTVYRYWNTLPEQSRPKLYVYGLSLGSFGSQSAFGGVEDMQARTDGALFMGTPNNSQPWGNITAERRPESPEWQPVVNDGVAVRFASNMQTITANGTKWQSPRVLYVQHGSDSVVWWSPNLLLHEPDWLKEKRAPDVSPNMHWIPIVTFLQVTVDQFFGTAVPVGHGHNYSNTDAYSWAAVLNDATIPESRVVKTQQIIDKYSIE